MANIQTIVFVVDISILFQQTLVYYYDLYWMYNWAILGFYHSESILSNLKSKIESR
jgi:predicted nucleic acid-binding protein